MFSSEQLFPGGSEMALRMREFDWSRTSLGPAEIWPQSLRSAVSILLPSKAQIVLFWGPELATLYNDAYRPALGAKHPRVLGLPARECWSEIWESGLRELFESVLTSGEAFWANDRLFVIERFGYPEETYFDVSYDPLRDETGRVRGVFCIVSETTARVINDRRLRILRALAERAADAKSTGEACAIAAATLADDPYDVPFALLYLLDDSHRRATLSGFTGIVSGTPLSPDAIDLEAKNSAWPFSEVIATGKAVEVDGLCERFGPLPGGAWPESAKVALVLPISRPGQTHFAGFIAAGISPRRPLDDNYRDFLHLLAAHIGSAIANARAYEEEKKRAEALAEIDRAKTAFFSNVSHEFRTPLTLMLGPVEDLLAKGRTDLSPAVVDQLDLVKRNGLRLLRLVNTLLDFSRIEAGRVRAMYEPTDLAAFTAELASNFRSACQRAGLALEVECAPLSEPVFVDRDMWEKIVLNLLSNAFKFTTSGGIRVSLRQCSGQAAPNIAPNPNHHRCVQLSIRDTGSGIPAEEMPRLFERFHRIHNAGGRTHEGTGIGLALVHELVKLHGGEVIAESAVEQGTTFIVTILLGRAHLPQDQIRESGANAATGTAAKLFVEEALRWLPNSSISRGVQRRTQPEAISVAPLPAMLDGSNVRPVVLVVDDNADMRHYMARLLSENYHVQTVADGEAALGALQERLPDLILADVMMPRLDGFGLLAKIRADARTRDLPLIMLSARAGEESRVEGMQAGADDYLVKPFSARELLARVGAHLQISRARREAGEALRQSEQSLRIADSRKDDFLAMLAHELRNPLAPIVSSLDLIKLGKSDEKLLAQAHATIERQVSHMVRLVDDLLDLSRIARDKVELRKVRVELAPVIHHSVESCRAAAAAANHELRVSLPQQAVLLDADPVRLAQVFGNLLTNACKYTDPGGIIELSAECEGGDVVVKVKDNGIGIPREMLSAVFEMFAQVDRSFERSQSGLGIGLHLVKRLVEMHGGTVRAHSDGPGRGSEFVVRLPVLAETLPQNPPAPMRVATVSAKVAAAPTTSNP